jgi:hypothetical protein
MTDNISIIPHYDMELVRIGSFRDSIYESKENDSIIRFKLFKNSYKVFSLNYKEFEKQLKKHETIDLNELLKTKNGMKKLGKYQIEITRCLHNFLASALTLIDNSRVQISKIDSVSFQDEYKKNIESFFTNNPTSIFVKDLRRFAQHYKMPQVSTSTHYSTENFFDLKVETKLFITTYHLKGFDWSSQSKKRIEQNPKGIEIKGILDEYFCLVSEFQKWFEKRLKQHLDKEFSFISKQEKELNRMQLVFRLNRYIEDSKNGKDEFEKLIFRHISTYFIRRINNCSNNDRVELIVKSLARQKIKTEDYIECIKNIYKD